MLFLRTVWRLFLPPFSGIQVLLLYSELHSTFCKVHVQCDKWAYSAQSSRGLLVAGEVRLKLSRILPCVDSGNCWLKIRWEHAYICCFASPIWPSRWCHTRHDRHDWARSKMPNNVPFYLYIYVCVPVERILKIEGGRAVPNLDS